MIFGDTYILLIPNRGGHVDFGTRQSEAGVD
jgi:hypothetical protein